MSVVVGDQAPDFTLPATGDKTVQISALKGKNVVLYFYPKDNTPGCTTEGKDFRDHIEAFTDLNTVIFGISRDSVKVHEGFKSKQSFPFDLIADKEEIACKAYDVIHLKKSFGKESIGLVRSTFIINTEGVISHVWRKVKVKEHVTEVLSAIKAL
ncbi:MAG: peroxiredoxin [Methylococcales bacterium]|nr:peroxiredoxin [Methylococcales bacterium]MBT7444149.1 peroxiredoxin [Methylococcales bacterium]